MCRYLLYMLFVGQWNIGLGFYLCRLPLVKNAVKNSVRKPCTCNPLCLYIYMVICPSMACTSVYLHNFYTGPQKAGFYWAGKRASRCFFSAVSSVFLAFVVTDFSFLCWPNFPPKSSKKTNFIFEQAIIRYKNCQKRVSNRQTKSPSDYVLLGALV